MTLAEKKLQGWLGRLKTDKGDLTRRPAKEVFEEKSDLIIRLTKERILTGYGMNGMLLHPTYEEDSGRGNFFKSPETAAAYQRMKMYRYGIQPTKGANLIMTGELYDNMYVDIDDYGAEVTSSYVGVSLNAKYVMLNYSQNSKNGAFVFSQSWVKEYLSEDIISKIVKTIKG